MGVPRAPDPACPTRAPTTRPRPLLLTLPKECSSQGSYSPPWWNPCRTPGAGCRSSVARRTLPQSPGPRPRPPATPMTEGGIRTRVLPESGALASLSYLGLKLRPLHRPPKRGLHLVSHRKRVVVLPGCRRRPGGLPAGHHWSLEPGTSEPPPEPLMEPTHRAESGRFPRASDVPFLLASLAFWSCRSLSGPACPHLAGGLLEGAGSRVRARSVQVDPDMALSPERA